MHKLNKVKSILLSERMLHEDYDSKSWAKVGWQPSSHEQQGVEATMNSLAVNYYS
jgi:hypothetical protein